MKIWKQAVSVFFLLIVVLSAIPATPQNQENPEARIEDLKKQVAALEARVTALEKQIEKLTLSIPRSFPDLKQLPKGWERR
jgi:cell division protein FtsB